MYALAIRRRLAIRRKGGYDPYPEPPAGARLSPSLAYGRACVDAPKALAWAHHPDDVAAWQRRARDKLATLSGWRPAARCETLATWFADDVDSRGLRHWRAYLRAEPNGDIPIDVLWQSPLAGPTPVVICLQGTNAGAHLSWGALRMPPDPVKIAAGLDLARQAVARGHVALCLEQICFGERREQVLTPRSADPCVDAFHQALLVGRTLVGDRASDVSAVIDWLQAGGARDTVTELKYLDLSRIAIVGHSSGGTTALHAAALDPRIAAVMASGCLGPIADTLGARRDSGGQNTIPGILNWLDLDDVVAMCAPRPFVGMSGTDDHIFPFAGARRVIAGAQSAYAAYGAPDRIKAVEIAGGHRFDPAVAWPAFDAVVHTASPGAVDGWAA